MISRWKYIAISYIFFYMTGWFYCKRAGKYNSRMDFLSMLFLISQYR